MGGVSCATARTARSGTTRTCRCGSSPGHPRTEVEGIAVVHVADVVLELLQFSAPDQRTEPPRTSDAGGHHVAFYVDDLDAAVAHLRAGRVRGARGAMPLPGPEAGEQARFVFALTPWGLALEFVSYPHGKAWQRREARDTTERTGGTS